MKPLIFAIAVMLPLAVHVDARVPSPLDTWELVENSLKFNVEAIIVQSEGEDPVPATPYVTLELYRGNAYRLSIGARAADGYAFPHFLPEPPGHAAPSTRATGGYGYYTVHSDTLRFRAHFASLIADGVDLGDVVSQSSDPRVQREYTLALSLVNSVFLELFNDLYAYRSGDRLVFVLPGDSEFAAAAGDSGDGIVWELRRVGGPPSTSRAAVQATVIGGGAEALTVAFARSISGRAVHYAWRAVTDDAGRADLEIVTLDRWGVTGYYSALARDGEGAIVGRWNSIPLNENRLQVVELTVRGRARVVSSRVLNAAKAAALPVEQAVAGLAPNFPNPFNSNTLIVYRLAAAGAVQLEIFNSLGQRVRTLVDAHQTAGRYRIQWDARDERGEGVAAGVYVIRLIHPGGVDARRMLFLK